MKKKLTLSLLLLSALLTGCSNRHLKDQTENKIPFDFPDLKAPVFRDQVFNIRDYGAKSGDTTFLNTKAIRNAIEACHNAGGGRVLVPAGVWLTGPVHLKSNVNLHLEEGSELMFSQRYDDYLPVVLIQRGGSFCYNYSPLVYARDCENIALTGTGVLNGRGQAWWPWVKRQPGMTQLFQMSKAGVPIEERVFGTEEAGVRPPFIQFLECKNVLLQGVTVKDGPSWNVHPVFCENLIIREIKIMSPHGPNNDGIDPDACRNVLIEDCYIDAGDDAICLKSGRDEEAWKIGRPLENVVIRRCTTKAGHGGFVIGSEMSAGVKNILVEDCHFDGTNKGLRFKSQVGRGGVVENVWARNITMEKIRNEAIHFDLLYYSKPVEGPQINAPTFRNIQMENITCESARIAISMTGLPGNYLRELFFKNVSIKARTGLISRDVHDLSFDNVRIIKLAE